MSRGRLRALLANRWDRWAILVAVLLLVVLAGLQCARAAGLPPGAREYRGALEDAVARYWPSGPFALLAGQTHQESGWRADARSPFALGCSQFTPATARAMAAAYPWLDPPMPWDCRWSLRAQVIYMLELLPLDAETVCESFAFAAASYNQGPRWTRRQRAASPTPGRYFGATEKINPGKTTANAEQTRGYVRRIVDELAPRYALAGWRGNWCAR